MANQATTTATGGLLGSLLTPKSTLGGVQTTTPATASPANNQNLLRRVLGGSAVNPASSSQQTGTLLTTGHTIAAPNPNASTIAKVHSATMDALGGSPAALPPAPSAPDAGQIQTSPFGLTAAQKAAAKTPAQLAAAGAPTSPTAPSGGTTAALTPGGIIGAIQAAANSIPSNPMIQSAESQFLQNAQQLPGDLEEATNQPGLEGSFNEGVANVNNAYSARQNALANAISQAIAPTTAQLGGLESIAGQIPAGLLYGAFGAGGNTGGTTIGAPALTYNPTTDSANFAQAVMNNQIPYSDAVSALNSLYPGIGEANLQAAITAAGGNLANIEAQTSANQQNIGTAATATATTNAQLQKAGSYALQTLQDLNAAYQNLGGLQKTFSPGFNNLATGISSAFGISAGATQAYNTSLQEARAAVSNALTAAGNTPTFSDSTATALLPDGASPQQIDAAISQIRVLMGQKIGTYGTGSVPVGGQAQNGTSNLYNW